MVVLAVLAGIATFVVSHRAQPAAPHAGSRHRLPVARRRAGRADGAPDRPADPRAHSGAAPGAGAAAGLHVKIVSMLALSPPCRHWSWRCSPAPRSTAVSIPGSSERTRNIVSRAESVAEAYITEQTEGPAATSPSSPKTCRSNAALRHRPRGVHPPPCNARCLPQPVRRVRDRRRQSVVSKPRRPPTAR